MHVLLALVVATMSGVDDAPKPTSRPIEARRVEGTSPATGPLISYEVHIVTTHQLAWRGRFDPWLKPVARQGGAVVWAAEAPILDELMKFLMTDASSTVLQSPKVITPASGEVRIDLGETINYVAHLERVADGPINQATKLAFKPQVDHLFDGVSIRLLSGTKDPYGLRSRVAINRDHLTSVQTTVYSEMVIPFNGVDDEDHRQMPKPAKISSTIQVPVVDSARVDGEWVIPREGALIVSLGTGQKKPKMLGFSEIRPEELVIIGYHQETGEAPTPIGAPVTAHSEPVRAKRRAAN